MKAKIFLIGLVGTLFYGTANAQFNWPEDRATAEEKNALYNDNLNQGNFRGAANQLSWLLINAPDLNKAIYINGVKIYDGLASKESDSAKKLVFQDSVMTLYDLRIKYFGEEGKVLNRKAYDAYKYFRDVKDRHEELFNLYKMTFELNGDNVMDLNLLPYMDVIRRYKAGGGSITDEEVLDIYEGLIRTIGFKINKGGNNAERLKTVRESINNLLVQTVKVDCDFVQNNLGPKLEAAPEDLKIAKDILRYSFAAKCMDLDIAIKAAEVVQKNEPDFGIAKLIAQSAAAKEDYETAIKYYEEAITLADDNTKKADVLYTLAIIQSKQGHNVSARDYARKAVSADPAQKDAYKLIGNLYYNSFNECKKGTNPIHDKAVYMAAYKMFQLAGDSAGMSRAKAQFPTNEEIFTWDMKVGDTYKVGCWINETVTIQKR